MAHTYIPFSGEYPLGVGDLVHTPLLQERAQMMQKLIHCCAEGMQNAIWI